MGYRLLADENVEPSTVEYLRRLDHEVATVADVDALALGASDQAIAASAVETGRVVLTQDDDFLSRPSGARILVQRDQTLSAREVGDIVHELSRHISQDDVTVEYVSRNWL